MDKGAIISIANHYSELVHSQIDVDKIILYGSYAKGTSNENSDIDIAVLVNHIDDNYFNNMFLLSKLTRKVDFRIEPVLIDANSDKSGFLTDILNSGIILFDKTNKTE